ncbi:MAG: quinolinate synthase NadA [Thermodesulfobacteriota bacterium]
MHATDDSNTLQEIFSIKKAMGPDLVILTHHYQRPSIISVGDVQGDSFELSRKASRAEARYIVFCGVHFMAQSAAVLARPDQTVQIPDPDAGCPMADMADEINVAAAWEDLTGLLGPSIRPVVYMNSSAELKAFCGRHGGCVCTSSNAVSALTWAFSQSDRVLFFPDQHLGRNSGHVLGIPPEQTVVYTPGKPLGGNAPETMRNARLILWDGFCHVHMRFSEADIQSARAVHPDCRVIVHPECRREVVAAADESGSTSQIVKYVNSSPSGATIVIGTEVHLIERMAELHPDKTILPLARSLCPNMYKITPEKLWVILRNPGTLNRVVVDPETAHYARIALNQMLALP